MLTPIGVGIGMTWQFSEGSGSTQGWVPPLPHRSEYSAAEHASLQLELPSLRCSQIWNLGLGEHPIPASSVSAA